MECSRLRSARPNLTYTGVNLERDPLSAYAAKVGQENDQRRNKLALIPSRRQNSGTDSPLLDYLENRCRHTAALRLIRLPRLIDSSLAPVVEKPEDIVQICTRWKRTPRGYRLRCAARTGLRTCAACSLVRRTAGFAIDRADRSAPALEGFPHSGRGVEDRAVTWRARRRFGGSVWSISIEARIGLS